MNCNLFFVLILGSTRRVDRMGRFCLTSEKNHEGNPFHAASQFFLTRPIFIVPTIPSSLATGPRFVETPAMTAQSGYVTGTRGQVCVVPKLRRVIALCNTLCRTPAPGIPSNYTW
jgi:hypothetical protein